MTTIADITTITTTRIVMDFRRLKKNIANATAININKTTTAMMY